VRALFEDAHLGAGDATVERLGAGRYDLVVTPYGHERRHPYLTEAPRPVPVLEVADYEELLGPFMVS
jgi:hypothetical protein